VICLLLPTYPIIKSGQVSPELQHAFIHHYTGKTPARQWINWGYNLCIGDKKNMDCYRGDSFPAIFSPENSEPPSER